ncbi:tRNA pseudouridine(38-40) synthase TruA [Mumia sp. zg.B53]|uniref:tRNA pseudouridine(38-40) synthase TruA n=1 Tax=Mumia sp. zg.B53 TaxID=2855449 RepID=UPI001C6EDF3D|nr:tRNA pseudouridine(38-40) synthase TruA [Mumia sp. zg.B53]MBW9213889.1 tRNA pseudouridine(38-40) synthase TruA [Mumia sp. zg.B53]
MRWRLDLAYDGGAYRGWASQPGLPSVQQTIEDALTLVLRLDRPARLTVAGRTDTGVHARGQVAHVDLPDELEMDEAHLLRRLDRVLPDDIVVRAARVAPDGFDARFSALRRRYVYRIWDGVTGPDPLHRNHVVHHHRPLDVSLMNDAAVGVLGEQDFAAFCRRREGASTIRSLMQLTTRRTDSSIVETTVVADAFCHSMVRSLMGALTAVGEGRHEPAWMVRVLKARTRDSRVKVMPSLGLTLEEVVYPAESRLAARAQETRTFRGPLESPEDD